MFTWGMGASILKLILISSTCDYTTFTVSFQCWKKKDLKKNGRSVIGWWNVNHFGIYGSKDAEGFSAFQHRSCGFMLMLPSTYCNGVNIITQNPVDGLFSNMVHSLIVIVICNVVGRNLEHHKKWCFILFWVFLPDHIFVLYQVEEDT